MNVNAGEDVGVCVCVCANDMVNVDVSECSG